MSTELLDELMERAKALAEEEKLRLAEFLTETAQAGSPSKQKQPESMDAISSAQGASKHELDEMRAKFQQRIEAARLSEEEAAHRSERMVWLKANRDAYAGQYVALDDSRLVASGATIQEVESAAREAGVGQPFIVYLFPLDSVPFGGW